VGVRSFARLAVALMLAAAAPSAVVAQAPSGVRPQLRALQTVPERTGWVETSRYAEVIRFVETVAAADPRMHLRTFGYSHEGRALPVVVVGTGLRDGSPESVRASGKLRVWVQGNIHAGEVEGKEAMQRMLREIALGAHPEWFETMVLLVAPIYNADGNERVRLTNRPLQDGPLGGMGQRPNAQDFDLNRDHMKLDSPEARSLVRAMTEYDPHLSVDLHTTNGTRHAYHLTYAPPLHPNTPGEITAWLRGELLPEVTRSIRDKHGWHTYHYGNVLRDPRTDERAWMTYDHRPRFNNNYIGLRNRFAILSEAFSYAPFEEREKVTYWFVEEILNHAHRNHAKLREIVERADAQPLTGAVLATVAEPLRTPGEVEILMGEVEELRHPYTGETFLRRLDVVRPERMLEYIAFQPLETERVPEAWFIPPEVTPAIERLEAHGIPFTRLTAPRTVRVESFTVDSTRASDRPFQGRNERAVWGRYTEEERTLPEGTVVVPAGRLGRLAFQLLEPRSDDGLLNWGILDAWIRPGEAYPILRTFRGGRGLLEP
jgi:hypothetical protein